MKEAPNLFLIFSLGLLVGSTWANVVWLGYVFAYRPRSTKSQRVKFQLSTNRNAYYDFYTRGVRRESSAK